MQPTIFQLKSSFCDIKSVSLSIFNISLPLVIGSRAAMESWVIITGGRLRDVDD